MIKLTRKKLNILSLSLILIIILIINPICAFAQNQIITTNTVWSPSDLMRTLVQGVQVASGGTLQIQPGTTVNGNGQTIRIIGTLNAIGAPAAIIHLNDVYLQCGTSGVSSPPCNINLQNVVFDGGRLFSDVFSVGGFTLNQSVFKHIGGTGYFLNFGPSGNNIITGNTFIDFSMINLSAINSTTSTISNNLFSSWRSAPGVSTAAIYLGYATNDVQIHGNSFLKSTSQGAINGTNVYGAVALDAGTSAGGGRMIADGNFFGSSDQSVIKNAIYDSALDVTRTTAITYQPYLTAPASNTPTLAVANPSASGIVAAVLPTGRSVTLTQSATIFATIINSTNTDFSSCTIVPEIMSSSIISLSSLRGIAQAGFSYSETNPSMNGVIGTTNAPFGLLHQQSRTFVLAFSPFSAMTATQVGIITQCDGADDAQVLPGINSAVLSFNSAATPDVIALAATLQNDGITHIPGFAATGVFAVATVNVGVQGVLTVTPTVNLSSSIGGILITPLTATICQTVPATGACIATPGGSVSVSIGANDTPTFAVFVKGNGAAIPLDAANSRVTVTITDAQNINRGSTSVAVTTQ